MQDRADPLARERAFDIAQGTDRPEFRRRQRPAPSPEVSTDQRPVPECPPP